MLLSENDIEAELSYAYLHAVAARAGFGCHATDRHTDNAGVDAILRVKERLEPDSVLTDFTVEVQLKATRQPPVLRQERYSFVLRVPHYDKLRLTTTAAPRLLVVLFLPEDPARWLEHSEEQLIARRCAYWISLRSAPTIEQATTTVYLPRANVVSPGGLRRLMTRFSLQEELDYEP